jgi:hypothetical protein
MKKPRTRTIETKFSIEHEDAIKLQMLVELASSTSAPYRSIITALEDNGYHSRRHVAYARGLLDAALMPIEGGNQ